MIAQHTHLARQIGIIGGNHTPFAISPKILGEIEAESAKVTHATRFPSLIIRPVCLAGVFDNDQVVLAGDLEQGIHIGALPVEMYRQDEARAGRDQPFDLAHIH